MRIEQALFAYLTGYAGLQALIGSRLYPLVLPQNCPLPAAVFQRISGPRERSHDGPSGLAHPRYQFSCWAAPGAEGGRGYEEACEVAEEIRIALDGFQGTMGGASGVRVDHGMVDNDLDGQDPESGLFRKIVDVVVWHEEATA